MDFAFYSGRIQEFVYAESKSHVTMTSRVRMTMTSQLAVVTQCTPIYVAYRLVCCLSNPYAWFWTDYAFSRCPCVRNARVYCTLLCICVRVDRIEVSAIENL